MNLNLILAIDNIKKYYEHGDLGITTGFNDIDKKLGKLQSSDLIIIAGRPSMGKTALCTNIAFNIANSYYRTNGKDGGKVAFFSLEMSAEQLASRVISAQAHIPNDSMRKGILDDTQFQMLTYTAKKLKDIPLFIDDTPGISIDELRFKARRIKRKHGLDVVFVDYLQLLVARKTENRVQEITKITQGLKALAKELNINVVALSQLSRTVESRDDKRPQLSDLRESGSIEQDADIVGFIYRAEYYISREEPFKGNYESDLEFENAYSLWEKKMERVKNLADFTIAKQRHGSIGNIKMFFDNNHVAFSDFMEFIDE